MSKDLSKHEKEQLANLESKLSHVRDVVRGIVKGFHTGMMLWGSGGTSKSYSVLEELKALKASHILHNSRITARGLVDVLERNPSIVHVIEDAESLMVDKNAPGVLRSALWSQSRKLPKEREVTWTAFQTNIRFIFTGGVIVISNANFAESSPEIRAIKTRINVVHLDVSDEEIKALMKKICLDGYTRGSHYLSPDECLEVREFIITRLTQLKRPLDLRLLITGFDDFLQWKTGNSHNHWQLLIEGRMAERVVYVARSDRKAAEARLALEIHAMKLTYAEKVKLWHDKTGLSKAAYDRALKRK